MGQVVWIIRANMGQTNTSANDYVQGQAGAQSTASSNASALIAAAIAALNLGTAATQSSSAFDPSGAAAAAQTAAISSAAASLSSAIAGLATVGRTGAYSDLTGKPTLGSAASQSTSAFDAAGAAASALSTAQTYAASQSAAAQAYAIQRANQTGSQTASTISDFSNAAISAVTWSTITGKPSFATVATSGSYADLSNKPSLGTQMAVDTGWTANTYAGVKTAVLVTYNTVITGTMSTALNLTSAGLGTSLVIMDQTLQLLVQQVAALRTALVAAKLPSV